MWFVEAGRTAGGGSLPPGQQASGGSSSPRPPGLQEAGSVMNSTCARAGGLAGLAPESVPAASGVSKIDTAPHPLCSLPEASLWLWALES